MTCVWWTLCLHSSIVTSYLQAVMVINVERNTSWNSYAGPIIDWGCLHKVRADLGGQIIKKSVPDNEATSRPSIRLDAPALVMMNRLSKIAAGMPIAVGYSTQVQHNLIHMQWWHSDRRIARQWYSSSRIQVFSAFFLKTLHNLPLRWRMGSRHRSTCFFPEMDKKNVE